MARLRHLSRFEFLVFIYYGDSKEAGIDWMPLCELCINAQIHLINKQCSVSASSPCIKLSGKQS